MKKYTTQYKDLQTKELPIAFRKVKRELFQASNNVHRVANAHLDSEDEVSDAEMNKLAKLEVIMDEKQLELDAVGMLLTGRKFE